MLILTIIVIIFTLFLTVVIGFTTYMMFAKRATPQIYYTSFDSIPAQSHGEFYKGNK
ncbi:DUF3951 domain-containing protein [Bacillus manliponensis]|uniref:DUF3951 domain-containing protein n=1 Tax=Bacillus manliponensis TaxID=574376 RepID=UPI0009FBFCCD|nr:DUF3951 domain-containing protein [Bacillus manliponensis]